MVLAWGLVWVWERVWLWWHQFLCSLCWWFVGCLSRVWIQLEEQWRVFLRSRFCWSCYLISFDIQFKFKINRMIIDQRLFFKVKVILVIFSSDRISIFNRPNFNLPSFSFSGGKEPLNIDWMTLSWSGKVWLSDLHGLAGSKQQLREMGELMDINHNKINVYWNSTTEKRPRE